MQQTSAARQAGVMRAGREPRSLLIRRVDAPGLA